MTVLSAQSIRRRGVFTPFCERTRCPLTGMTYGLSAAGYDVRIAESIVIIPESVLTDDVWFTKIRTTELRTRLERMICRQAGVGGHLDFEPRWGYTLASTVEHFAVPDDVIAFVHDKSTLARQGIAVQNTVIEPGWRGHLTLEITNHGRQPVYLPAGSPIAQIVLHPLDEPTSQPYTGRYQDQEAGPQEARFLDVDKEG